MTTVQQLRFWRRNWSRRIQLGMAGYRTAPATWPDFMCIGAPRASTTWLHRMLQSDPRVFLPHAKELHFFDEDPGYSRKTGNGLRWRRPFYFDMQNPAHLRWYWMQFRGGAGRLKGEITPTYAMLSRERVDLLAGLNPRLKVIYLIRNPVDRAWSALRNTIYQQKGRRYVEDASPQMLFELIMHPEVLRHGHYREAIETWGSVIAPERILYLFYDDILADPRSELERVHAFLELGELSPAVRTMTRTRINAAPSMSLPANIGKRLSDYYEPQVEFLESRFDRNLNAWK